MADRKMPKPVMRWVLTFINVDGQRTLALPRQGEYTKATKAEIDTQIASWLKNTSMDTLKQVFGEKGPASFEARECPCYPVHFDPTNCWFD